MVHQEAEVASLVDGVAEEEAVVSRGVEVAVSPLEVEVVREVGLLGAVDRLVHSASFSCRFLAFRVYM